MANQVIPTELFESKFKRLKKKFLTLEQEMRELTEALEITPTIGTALGSGLYKIRLGSKSKGGGKSGGFRVITYLVSETQEGTDVYLIMMFDKSEESNIKKEILVKIIKQLFE
jgi:hypothetical protein